MRSPEVSVSHVMRAVHAPERGGMAPSHAGRRCVLGTRRRGWSKGCELLIQPARLLRLSTQESAAPMACSGCMGCVGHLGLSFPGLAGNSALRLLAEVVGERPCAPAFTKGRTL